MHTEPHRISRRTQINRLKWYNSLDWMGILLSISLHYFQLESFSVERFKPNWTNARKNDQSSNDQFLVAFFFLLFSLWMDFISTSFIIKAIVVDILSPGTKFQFKMLIFNILHLIDLSTPSHFSSNSFGPTHFTTCNTKCIVD